MTEAKSNIRWCVVYTQHQKLRAANQLTAHIERQRLFRPVANLA
jgi:hypothetical protein